MDRPPPTPEFTRVERVDHLAEGEVRPVALVADPAERAALARRFGLVALDRLEASGSLARLGDVIRAELVLHAHVTQSCVVTLAPVASAIEEPVVLTFAPEVPESGHEVDVDADADDPPEPIVEGAVELGEPVAEALGLALDPYPRAPGANFPGWPADAAPEPAPGSPFQALSRWRE